MLVLTRSEFEEIIIGSNEVCITILAIGDNQVKLGFTAAKDISINRREVYNRIEQKRENKVNDYA
ncbi:MAG: carbon storage regulator [Gammaproteobacteria bacterium]|nr:carbon storage regulator [Gammaproteobacteria bacterium]